MVEVYLIPTPFPLHQRQLTPQSISGRSTSLEDTEQVMRSYLPPPLSSTEEKSYRIVYAVHKILESNSIAENPQSGGKENEKPTQFIGLITLKSLDASSLALPESLTLPKSTANEILTVELAYIFLPTAWGSGYATESVNAVFSSLKIHCQIHTEVEHSTDPDLQTHSQTQPQPQPQILNLPKNQPQPSKSSWISPFTSLYIRAIVNQGNPTSKRVMEKIGMEKKGIYEWTGRVFLAGEWRVRDRLQIFGKVLVGWWEWWWW